MHQQLELILIDAVDRVTAWDLPDEDLTQAVNDQAKLMSGVPPEDCLDTH